MDTTLNIDHYLANQNLRDEVARRTPSIGAAEWELALSRVLKPEDGAPVTHGEQLTIALANAIEEHRKSFFPLGQTCFTKEQIEEHRAEAEKAAREALLANSADLNELNRLEAEAADLKRRADAKAQVLQRQ
jgi:hypothetical protein